MKSERSPPFPWRKYTKKELITEFFKLKDKVKSTLPTKHIKYSKIGLMCSNYFFQKFRFKVKFAHHQSCYDSWRNKEKRDKVIKYFNSHPEATDLFSTLRFFFSCPAQFPIFVSSEIYRYFNSKNILDCYAGFGDRCLGAMALDLNYTGVDSNTKLKPAYDKMLNFFSPYTDSDVEIYFQKSEDFIKTKEFKKLKFDLVFSSPPFWKGKKILEAYPETETDYETFLTTSLIPVMEACLKRKVWVCLYIPEDMYLDLTLEFGKCKETLTFGSSSKAKAENKAHNIYCWKR